MILQCDEDEGKNSFIVALDKKTGKEAWKTPRKVQASWSTPLVVRAEKRAELITSGNELIISYDPKTGKELWTAKGHGSNAIGTPLVGHGMVFVYAGFPVKKTMAIKLGGSGDITNSRVLPIRQGDGLRAFFDTLRRLHLPDVRPRHSDMPRRQDRQGGLRRRSHSRARHSPLRRWRSTASC